MRGTIVDALLILDLFGLDSWSTIMIPLGLRFNKSTLRLHCRLLVRCQPFYILQKLHFKLEFTTFAYENRQNCSDGKVPTNPPTSLPAPDQSMGLPIRLSSFYACYSTVPPLRKRQKL
jgi:hypothetical protein